MSLNVLKLDLNSARWMRKLVSIDAQSYAALTSQSLRGTIGPLQDTELIPYPLRHRNLRNLTLQTLELFPPTHGSIMLPPRQPRVFARLARWQ